MSLKTHPCRYIALVACIPPIIASLALWLMPNTVTRIADAGTFVSTDAAPCGFGCDTVTTVHTTTGVFVISGVFSSVAHAQPMVLRDSTHGGLKLCVVGDPDSCAQLATGYAGPLQTVGEAPYGVTYDQRTSGTYFAGLWFMVGFMALILCAIVTEDADAEPKQKATKRGP